MSADTHSVPTAAPSLLLSTTRIMTFSGQRVQSAASGFFFESKDGRLFLVSSRHVLADAATGHHPDRMDIELHIDADNLTRVQSISLDVCSTGPGAWRQGRDEGGPVDVAVLELDRTQLPASSCYTCFTPAHLQNRLAEVDIGQPVLIVGFPLGFHDTLHHLAVVRQAAVASAFGLRFQGQGYFLTDARTHRGTSGAPVVMHSPDAMASLPWTLLGVHSSRMDMGGRDTRFDESLGLNCAWYADILLTLTA